VEHDLHLLQSGSNAFSGVQVGYHVLRVARGSVTPAAKHSDAPPTGEETIDNKRAKGARAPGDQDQNV
jgi:hypothetical protein